MRAELFMKHLQERVLILDGAMGTMIQQARPTAEDFGGAAQEGCNELLTITRPDLITRIHRAYLEAGADIIETNTFGASSIVLAEYGCADRDAEINRRAAVLARTAADAFSTAAKPRFVAGSLGPTTELLEFSRRVSFDQMAEAYYRQACGLLDGGIDFFLIETCQSALNVKAAGIGIRRACQEKGCVRPLSVSWTMEPSGRTLTGQTAEAFYLSVRHLNPIMVGLNCGTGAELMREPLRQLTDIASCAVGCYPNAGLPDAEGQYSQSPAEFAQQLTVYFQKGWMNLVGGCCGTTPEHIRALAEAVAASAGPNSAGPNGARSWAQRIDRPGLAGRTALWPHTAERPILVGERANAIGSRRFKQLLAAGGFEEGAEVARAQEKSNAQVVDLCVANPERVELEDMMALLDPVTRRVAVPLMIDSTDPKVMEEALKRIPGKAVINSLNLEKGPLKVAQAAALLRTYGAAVVVSLIDEEGMAVTRERKVALAERLYRLLVNEHGVAPRDLIFDPLVFPVGTGDPAYQRAAVETIEGTRLIKRRFPDCATILGISNVSFGLPAAGRDILNAVFVHHNVLAGLDYAIFNAEKYRPYEELPPAERCLAEDLLFNNDEKSLRRFAEFYRDRQTAIAVPKPGASDESIPKDGGSCAERLIGLLVEGTKTGLYQCLDEALQNKTALAIINGPLRQGMEEVGRLFNAGTLIIAEVLQSAEVMKAAVDYLKPHMESGSPAARGKILIATVKGDVHDIGKNLVKIILENNGYAVVDLGVKVASEQLIEAYRREKPAAIGLSGLLVRSVQEMKATAVSLDHAGITVPLLLGGAALTRTYAEEQVAAVYRGPVLYARDAMDGLSHANRWVGEPEEQKLKAEADRRLFLTPPESPEFLESLESLETPEFLESLEVLNLQEEVRNTAARSCLAELAERPAVKWPELAEILASLPESLDEHLVSVPLAAILPKVDIFRFLRRYVFKHIPGAYSDDVLKKAKYEEILRDFLAAVEQQKWIRATAVFRFFAAGSKGDDIYLYDPRENQFVNMTFPRLANGTCLADFLAPAGFLPDGYPGGTAEIRPEALRGRIGLFAASAGHGVRERAQQWMDKGNYMLAYLLQALSLELAEVLAEEIHAAMAPTGKGLRVSPGYPACPNLEDQAKIFRLLHPERVGIELTEGMMLDPEASVSAFVFPEAPLKRL